MAMPGGKRMPVRIVKCAWRVGDVCREALLGDKWLIPWCQENPLSVDAWVPVPITDTGGRV